MHAVPHVLAAVNGKLLGGAVDEPA